MAHALGPKARTNKLTFFFEADPRIKVSKALHMLDPELPPAEAYEKHYDNYHLKPQIEILDDFRGMVDFIGHFARLNADWRIIQRELSVGPLPHLNRRDTPPWQDTDWSFLGSRYDEDFELCRLSSF